MATSMRDRLYFFLLIFSVTLVQMIADFSFAQVSSRSSGNNNLFLEEATPPPGKFNGYHNHHHHHLRLCNSPKYPSYLCGLESDSPFNPLHHQFPPPFMTNDDGIDPRYGVEKRLIPSGPNPLHN